MSAEQILSDAAATYAERRKVYGDNYKRVGRALAALYPDGLHLRTEEDFTRFQLHLQDVVKTCRYAENFLRGGHADSLLDGSVYKAMLASVDKEAAEERALMAGEKNNGA